MKNTKYFPFERNNYFYGKLLSVDDFRLEQKYGNDKRRMINRFLYGTGVVTGMNVVAVDDTNLLIENGLALDNFGREIVIDAPVVRSLNMLEGFEDYEEDKDTAYLYLCVAYEEEKTQAVHSIHHSGANSDAAYNKIREGYRLFLTKNEPENFHLSSRSLFESVQNIYQGKGIRVRQILPRFAKSKEPIELKIEVENMGQQEHFAFSYEVELTCLSYETHSRMTVSFDDRLFEKAGRYTFTYRLDTLGVKQAQGTVSVMPDSFKLRIGRKQIQEDIQAKASVFISSNDERDEVRKRYYEKGIDQILKEDGSPNLYLAKISLLRAGDSVMIEEIEKMPFGQYITSGYLQDALFQMTEQNGVRIQSSHGGTLERSNTGRNDTSNFVIAEGVEELELGIGAAKGKKIFSREISHGLGMGRTTIVLGLEGIEKNQAFFGAADIFKEDIPMVDMAVKTDFQKGTFVIGLRMQGTTPKERIRIHWTAIQDRKELLEEKRESRIFIRPNVLNLNTRESYYLEAVCSNMTDTSLIWQVNDNGGTIDENGLYTAPNTAGVYEVTVVSAAYPEIRASIFVIVREKGAD